MHPESTFELSIDYKADGVLSTGQIKEQVKAWLFEVGETSFVEGVVDGLDVDFDYENAGVDYYKDLGGDGAPLSIYRYDKDYLDQLNQRLCLKFGSQIKTSLSELATEAWMEGWKESFRPFATEKFYVYPPWCEETVVEPLISMVIEPGMAFGTGQHATTQLCLQQIEGHEYTPASRSLDVGTGTGILSIAMKQLGCGHVDATDIDPDAIIACRENARANGQEFSIQQMSVPSQGTYDYVVANILFVVIRRIFDQLIKRVKPDGYLLISGVLKEEFKDMNQLASDCNLELIKCNDKDGWVSLLYRTPS